MDGGPSDDGRTKPSPLLIRTLFWIMPSTEESQTIVGDLIEEFGLRLRSQGPAEARRQFRHDSLGLITHIAWYRLRSKLAGGGEAELGEASILTGKGGGGGMLEEMRQDVRFALRAFGRHRGFTVLTLLVLTLGIGMTTAIFSVVDTVLLKQLPYAEPDRLMTVSHIDDERGTMSGLFSPQDYDDLLAAATSYDRLGAYWYVEGQTAIDLLGEEAPTQIAATYVSEGFLPTLGVEPMLGRSFTPEEVVEGAAPVVVVSYGLWQTSFGADPTIVGRTINLESTAFTVIGVMPSTFRYPDPGVRAWLPISLITDDAIPHVRQLRWMNVIGRLAEGRTREVAYTETSEIMTRLAREYPDTNEGWGSATVSPLREALVGPIRPALMILMASTAMILMIVCANIGSLLLARTTARGRELAVRVSMGASSGRLIRQLLTESVVLALIGGVLGIAVAAVGVQALLGMSAGSIPLAENVGVDARMAAFALVTSLATGLMFGMIPALRISKLAPAGVLKEGASVARGRKGSMRSAFVVAQTALAVVLVVGSGLMIRSLSNLLQVDPGFQTEDVLTFSISVASDVGPGESVLYKRNLLEAIGAVPGVMTVGASKTSPLAGGGEPYTFSQRASDGTTTEIQPESGAYIVLPGFFETLGMTFDRGRPFTLEDPRNDIVVNRTLAERLWPGADPIGQSLFLGDFETTVIGVVQDVRHDGLDTQARTAVYVLDLAFSRSLMNIFVKVEGDSQTMAASIRDAVWSVNRTQTMSEIIPLADLVEREAARPRFLTVLLGGFAALALGLAALGLYGVISFMVGRRFKELGIRIALGARPGEVIKVVVIDGVRITGVGLGAGLLGAFWLSRLMTSVLFGVEPDDPATFVTVACVVGVVSLMATLVPALRALRLDPLGALHAE
jgi:predicted permease